ncbi:MAG: M43 family zinc metalloprotease [Chitinophagales bacterium]|nr:M43 family zinc metalloprotease [Chitinophagales bacterium]MDW8419714.1 M43 family zinc metalloprotease [Chitinophagales bacterium]
MTLRLFFVLLIVPYYRTIAQIQRCATSEVVRYIQLSDPDYVRRVDEVYTQARALAEKQLASRNEDDTIFHIRCVFHVVYAANKPQENIPDSVIYSQIEVLNEDYRRLNADTSKTREVFLPVAADTKIQFELATEDPNGQPTNGITRQTGNGGFFGFNPIQDNVKSNSTGGRDPWPTDRYLNIWVCNLFAGILGYAFPPSNAPGWPANASVDSARQGVVLHYQVVGRNNPNPIDPAVARGRSATHEIGHYLGLRHIWGDTTGCNKFDGDGIPDTPKQADAHQQNCDTTDNTCADSPTDFPDMLENYMDYSDDRCLNMFTLGQKEIMRAILRTSRRGIAYTTLSTTVKNAEADFTRFTVSPNPAGDIAWVNITLPKHENTCQVRVTDTAGREVASCLYTGQPLAIPTYSLPAGIYHIQAVSHTKNQTIRMIVNPR